MICGYFERLDLAATIDRLVPYEGDVPLGTRAEVLIANRLLRPKALYRVGDAAQQAAVTDSRGLTAEQLNDDRLGRALERLADHADAIQAALVLHATEVFALDVARIHYDLTSVELCGASESPPDAAATTPAADARGTAFRPTAPRPACGRTKSGKKHVKQSQPGLDVTGDGGVPVGRLPLDGNAGESPSHPDNLEKPGQLLPKGPLLYLADTKLDTPANLLAIKARQGPFLCGGGFSPRLKERFLKLRHKLRPVAYRPKSQDNRPPRQRDHDQAFEVRELLAGEIDGRPVRLRYRLIFVWSESKARQGAATRVRHVAQITEEFEAVRRNLNRYRLKTRAAVVRRLEGVCGRYAAGALFRYELSGDEAGVLALRFRLDGAAVTRWQQSEGVYVLKTDLPSGRLPVAKVLGKDRGRGAVERRFHHLKGPRAVAPVFLKNPERIAGLLCVLVWALMVLALMERQVRRRLRGQPLVGLYPEGRPSAAPTGPAIVVVQEGTTATRYLAQPTAVQQRLLQLLDLPPSARHAFKRRCGVA